MSGPMFSFSGAIWLALALAGLAAGGRATWLDFKTRRWLWTVLDLAWTLAAIGGFLLAYAVYDYVP